MTVDPEPHQQLAPRKGPSETCASSLDLKGSGTLGLAPGTCQLSTRGITPNMNHLPGTVNGKLNKA